MSGAAGAPAAGAGRAAWLDAARALDAWMRARDYAGYDPHDLLSSRSVRRLCLGSRWLAVAWTQLGKRSPVQLRPLLGVRPARNPKGIGLTVAAYVRLAAATGDLAYRTKARELVEWLGECTAAGYPGAGWGYPFPWANRDFFAPAGTPSSVVTAFVGHALLDAGAAFGWADAVELARSAGTFLRAALNRTPGPDGTFCFSYTPLDRRCVHNANVVAASLLARVAAATGEAELAEEALAAARFSAAAQRADGSWPYGVGARNGWVDSFHTGYTLVGLHGIGESLGTGEFAGEVERGLRYWERAFLVGPAVGFHAHRPFPVDAHAVAHAILMLVRLRSLATDALVRARALADWSLREMRAADGSFHYLRGRVLRNRLPYMRWVQAWSLLALSELARAEAEREERGAGVAGRGARIQARARPKRAQAAGAAGAGTTNDEGRG